MTAAALHVHLQTGATHTCTCWSLTRKDGVAFGFTDHDRPLAFDGLSFSPQSGMSAQALASSAGLSVNNSAALGALSADAITEADIAAGRYDGALVTMWRVRWDDVTARQVRFRGTLGEITRAAGGFEAELLGLTEALNQTRGRSYLTSCGAVLGDARCGFDISNPLFSATHVLTQQVDENVLWLDGLAGFHDDWFENGFCKVLTGQGTGLQAAIKSDVIASAGRRVTLWSAFPNQINAGDRIRLIAGCDKRAETCREKFANLVNFQGFPDIPGDDWLVSVPRSDGSNTGTSRRRRR